MTSIPDKGNTLVVGKISFEAKLALIKRAESGEKIARLCREVKISRKTFYKWLSIYKRSKPHLVASRLSDKRFKCNRRSFKALDVENKSLLINRILAGYGNLAVLCREAGVSRKTCYKWLKRYQKSGEEGLVSRRPNGSSHYRSLAEDKIRLVVGEALANPYLSVSGLCKRLGGSVGHHGIQNVLYRENLNTIHKRLAAAQGKESGVQVAPLYVPEMPMYRLRMLLAPFVTVPKLVISNPKKSIVLVFGISPFILLLILWLKVIVSPAQGASSIGLFFASIALFFGLFFFLYSLSYYIRAVR